MAGINLVLTGCGDEEGVTVDYVVAKNETMMPDINLVFTGKGENHGGLCLLKE